MNKVRCAIYTRKSSEEGLEQDFNSLHAQREACAAYVLSQASEGWSALPEVYDDGGISGGTLERPALKRLLDDIAAGKIDIVVVYKVDRLTRSLLDFSKLVEVFDKAGVSFVSITQSFNTTTSMGRLTLNMLLSFAQFEREVTAERIRDKIAASKARGMWMGGTPPLGYRPDGRSLAVVDNDAALVRDIFARYRACGNVRMVAEELATEGVFAPVRHTSQGRTFGGVRFSRGQIYKHLSNPIYVGEIHHRGTAYNGQHEGIIERQLWDEVQDMLAGNLQGERTGTRIRSPSLLAGLIVDDEGESLVATHACKGKIRYRYYVSKALQHDAAASSADGMRIPAKELEGAVVARLAEALDDPLALLASTGTPLDPTELRTAIAKAEALARSTRNKDRGLVRSLVSRVTIHPRQTRIELRASPLLKMLGVHDHIPAGETIELVSVVRLTRTGLAMRLVQANGKAAVARGPDPALIRLLLKARSWWSRLATGEIDIATLAREEQVNDSWMTRVVRLNFLAPEIVEAILNGEQPARLTADSLALISPLPIAWREQREAVAAL
ncbi:recombinase family protein [Novosphingobium sp. Gsoil 351]|uniref:recombinase family protein n=1 Tax=Novosphingobium sp. Gsoil 351 TaxID=2675225 RepID=UPI0012B4C64F|nr:recombinase family protein [Novosphingobium sp. Gsoil 351]QGN54240.1 recombinase family protein [Novosphingobium sp. Gsoil 351]